MTLTGKKLVKLSISTIITAAFVIAVIMFVDLQKVQQTITSLDVWWLFLTFLLYVITYILRAWRFSILLKEKLGPSFYMGLVAAHNFFNAVLPLRIGEFSYVLILNQKKIATAKSLVTLGIARFFDIIAILVIFIVCVALYITQLPQVIVDYLPIVIVIAILAICGVLSLFFVDKIINFIDRKMPSFSHMLHRVKSVDVVAKNLRSSKSVAHIGFASMLIWLFKFLFFAAMFHSMHISVPLLQMLIMATFIELSAIIPAQGFAGFGTIEAVWTAVFVAFGFEAQHGASFGITGHLIMVAFYTFCGIIGIIYLKQKLNISIVDIVKKSFQK